MIWQISRQQSCIEFTAELLHGCCAAVASATLHDQLRWLDVPDRVRIVAATLSGNSLRQTVHTHPASVHQAAKLVAALLRVAG